MESLRDGASVEIVPELAPVRIGRRPIPRGSYENTFDNRNESAPLTEDLEVPLRVARGAPRARRERGQHLGAGDFRRRRRSRRLRAPAQGGYSVPSIIEPDFMLQKCGTPQSFAMLAHCEQESAALIASQT